MAVFARVCFTVVDAHLFGDGVHIQSCTQTDTQSIRYTCKNSYKQTPRPSDTRVQKYRRTNTQTIGHARGANRHQLAPIRHQSAPNGTNPAPFGTNCHQSGANWHQSDPARVWHQSTPIRHQSAPIRHQSTPSALIKHLSAKAAGAPATHQACFSTALLQPTGPDPSIASRPFGFVRFCPKDLRCGWEAAGQGRLRP